MAESRKPGLTLGRKADKEMIKNYGSSGAQKDTKHRESKGRPRKKADGEEMARTGKLCKQCSCILLD